MNISIGDRVIVKSDTNDILKERGWIAHYMTKNVDGMIGTVVNDHMDVVSPHLGVDLGFDCPVGIPPECLERLA